MKSTLPSSQTGKIAESRRKATTDEPIQPFRVCNSVTLGPLLPGSSPESIRDVWCHIEKNKSSNDPSKTKGDPRFKPRNANHPRDEPDKYGIVEATSDLMDQMITESCNKNLVFYDFNSVNLLAKAVHVAFYEHYPLRLSPDVIWLTVIQGLAKHIDKNPEHHRNSFVNFGGKKTLTVTRPDFVKGSKDNDWTTVFPEFAAKIAACIGESNAASLTCDFSTSTPTDRICSHIALMDTVKHYFQYKMLCGCGIPSVELTGTVSDWVHLRKKADILHDFAGLRWWTNELLPVLDHFVEAAKGNPDIKFWNSICNMHGASGCWMHFVTGWIQVFFPYTNDGESHPRTLSQWRNYYDKGTGNELEAYNKGTMDRKMFHGPFPYLGFGLKLDLIPVGVSQAPFIYIDLATSTKHDMSFNAGIVAVLQDQESKALEPATGWAVLDHFDIAA